MAGTRHRVPAIGVCTGHVVTAEQPDEWRKVLLEFLARRGL
ncbi:hypothetical protein [Nocardia sp. NPDC058497]